eukprot:42048-Prorocentrum_minimum.AAC.2
MVRSATHSGEDGQDQPVRGAPDSAVSARRAGGARRAAAEADQEGAQEAPHAAPPPAREGEAGDDQAG